MLAWLDRREPARRHVRGALAGEAVMSWINVAEVYYRTERQHGRPRAEEVLQGLRVRIALDEATPRRTIEAARVKAEHPIALADCFAVATARAHEAPLLTGDPELIDAPDLGCAVVDLR